MKYLFFICLCLGLYNISSHSLRMKVTQAKDCTTYENKKDCVANTNCVWNTNCQQILDMSSMTRGLFNTVSSLSSTTPIMQSASTIK